MLESLPSVCVNCTSAAGLEALQSLRHQLSMAKYQQLKKDLEPQETAGLDAALTNTLQQLMRQTPVEAAQVCA